MEIEIQILWLFLLSIPIACVAWTVTHETIFKELRDYCTIKMERTNNIFVKKFFYLITCEYCFSHYITVFFLLLTDFKLLLDDWRGYIISGFSLVFISNFYMTLFGLLRQGIKKNDH